MIRLKSILFLMTSLWLLDVMPTPATTIVDNVNKYSYGANIGWINWQGDVSHGAVFNSTCASGFIHGANVGWINLGGGMPVNNTHYSNTSANDFGVNVDATSDPNAFILSGYAYGANIGWINFDVQAQAGVDYQPRIDKQTGILKGYAWSANVGWIALESPGIAQVKVNLNQLVPTPTPTPTPTPPLQITCPNTTLFMDEVEVGKGLFVDREYVFEDPIPGDLRHQIYIKMPNDEKDNPYFSLGITVNQPVVIVVAESELITTPPQWLQDWTKRGDQLITSDAIPLRILYQKRFPAGTIILGCNHTPGMFDYSSMYSVMIMPIKNGAQDWQFYQ